jgi:hypothetical protein
MHDINCDESLEGRPGTASLWQGLLSCELLSIPAAGTTVSAQITHGMQGQFSKIPMPYLQSYILILAQATELEIYLSVRLSFLLINV